MAAVCGSVCPARSERRSYAQDPGDEEELAKKEFQAWEHAQESESISRMAEIQEQEWLDWVHWIVDDATMDEQPVGTPTVDTNFKSHPKLLSSSLKRRAPPTEGFRSAATNVHWIVDDASMDEQPVGTPTVDTNFQSHLKLSSSSLKRRATPTEGFRSAASNVFGGSRYKLAKCDLALRVDALDLRRSEELPSKTISSQRVQACHPLSISVGSCATDVESAPHTSG